MIKNILPLVVIFSVALLRGQDIAIEPIFFGTHRTAGGIWQWEDGAVIAGGGYYVTTETGWVMLTIDLTVWREVYPQLWLEVGASRDLWDCAGFNTQEPTSQGLTDIVKTSFSLGFYYNFRLLSGLGSSTLRLP